MAEPDRGSPLWRFSLGFYRRPGVAAACLALQDGCGVDVNVLLLGLWLATLSRSLTPAAARSVCAQAGAWRDDVVVPLRTLRRRLKDGLALVEPGATELFRTKIKAVELEAERLQQEALFALSSTLTTTPAPSVAAAARANVAAYAAAIDRSFTPEPVEVLIAALAAEPPGTR